MSVSRSLFVIVNGVGTYTVYRIRRISMGADIWTSWYFNIEGERFAIYTEKWRENRIEENMRG